jgi:hypothetical protein
VLARRGGFETRPYHTNKQDGIPHIERLAANRDTFTIPNLSGETRDFAALSEQRVLGTVAVATALSESSRQAYPIVATRRRESILRLVVVIRYVVDRDIRLEMIEERLGHSHVKSQILVRFEHFRVRLLRRRKLSE